jgi:HEAT repeat protein
MSIFDNLFGKKKENGQTNPSKQEFHTPDFDTYNEFEQIFTIFDYTLNTDFAIANKAAETVNRLFNSVQIFKNKQLYNTFRYLKINKADIRKFERFNKDVEATLLCIASMNGNGYSREEALNRLIKLQTQRTIPFILFRLADWVTPIREKAETAITTFLVEENTVYFIQNHKLINWLLRVERANLSGLYDQIIKSITSKHLKSEQLTGLNDGDRFFYYMSFAKNGLIDRELIDQMLNDKYYLIKILLIKHLYKVENLKVILIKLLSDKSHKIRLGAVNLIASQDLNEYETILRTLIFDNSTSIRIEARRLLSKIHDCDFRKMYLDSISNQQLTIGAILGLSEVSDKSEISFIQKYLNSERARIRTASLIGIFNLDNNIGTETAYQILETNNPISTRRAAENILAKEGIDFKRLRKLYDLTDSTGKKIILRLFNRYSGWSVAGDFLKALTDNDRKIQLMATVFLESWNNYTIRLATKQSPEDKDYVLGWYKKTNEMGIGLPINIPFIFGEK